VTLRLESSRGGERVVPTAGRVAVVFYEPRERLEDNASLKRALRALEAGEPTRLEVLAVGDVADFDFVPARAIVRRVVGALARANDLEVLFDWSGALAGEPYSLTRGKSNVLVIDHEGTIVSRDEGVVGAVEPFVERVRALVEDSPRSRLP